MAGVETKFQSFFDRHGAPTLIRPAPGYVAARTLAASVAESVTVPPWAKYAIFASNGDFFAKCDTVATIPTDDDVGDASELNPAAWDVSGKATISLISSGTPTITVSFYGW